MYKKTFFYSANIVGKNSTCTVEKTFVYTKELSFTQNIIDKN